MSAQQSPSGPYRMKLELVVLATGLILLLPWLAMQLSAPGVAWTLSDFVIMGGLLLITGTLLEFARTKLHLSKYRLAVILAIILGFLYLWAELAVGIFTTWGS